MQESFLQWDPAQVSSYLRSAVEEDVSSEFIENNIDGSLLPFVTTEHLRELGIRHLGTRLRVKRAINELIAAHYSKNLPNSANDADFRLNTVNINSNYVSMEALTLSLLLLRDFARKSKMSAQNDNTLKKLNDNFNKLKTDLNPVIRLVKENKPLPTPTLDPGLPVSLPTFSLNLINSTNSWSTDDNVATLPTSTSSNTLAASSSGGPSAPNSAGSIGTAPTFAPANLPHLNSGSSLLRHPPSPTQSKRFSSGSILSMGVGKMADVKQTQPGSRFLSKPRLVESKPTPSEIVDRDSTPDPVKQQLVPPSLKNRPSSSSLASVQPIPGQPLKQLKASLDDTCLKILQQAMKRHHIPRDMWSKYVLVVCYGDKERILKLTEKPVIVFKELQELGKNPAIMLRELATSTESEKYEEPAKYEDARIGDDIPGGTL